jgi:hypothetical protein
MHFRSDSLPIVVPITDSAMHAGKRALDKTATAYDTANQYPYSFSTFDSDALVTKLNELGARFVGVAADDGDRATTPGAPYGYLAYLADKTNSYVIPSAFSGGACKTGVSGATVPADGPMVDGIRRCRMVFSINTSGTGLSTSIVDGVFALLNSIRFDVYVEAYNGPSETIDVVSAFLEKVEPKPSGGKDPVTGGTCVAFPAGQVADLRHTPKALAGAGDIAETIREVTPGAFYCFSVVPKPNTTVPATTTAQTFLARLAVTAVKPAPASGTFALGTDRDVLFIVPPKLN